MAESNWRLVRTDNEGHWWEFIRDGVNQRYFAITRQNRTMTYEWWLYELQIPEVWQRADGTVGWRVEGNGGGVTARQSDSNDETDRWVKEHIENDSEMNGWLLHGEVQTQSVDGVLEQVDESLRGRR
jgi:hypothetical protein